MNTCIYLSYKGLGANLLHLSYCHEVSKKFGPVSIITLCKNLEDALKDDPQIKKVYYLDKYHKKFIQQKNHTKNFEKSNSKSFEKKSNGKSFVKK